jgi:hypothetical protein
MKIAIVGTKFRPGGIAAVSELRKGVILSLVREPTNPHDHNAIAVYSRANEHLGYVPRPMNIELARELDAGHRFVAVLTDEAIIDLGDIKFAPKLEIRRV